MNKKGMLVRDLVFFGIVMCLITVITTGIINQMGAEYGHNEEVEKISQYTNTTYWNNTKTQTEAIFASTQTENWYSSLLSTFVSVFKFIPNLILMPLESVKTMKSLIMTGVEGEDGSIIEPEVFTLIFILIFVGVSWMIISLIRKYKG